MHSLLSISLIPDLLAASRGTVHRRFCILPPVNHRLNARLPACCTPQAADPPPPLLAPFWAQILKWQRSRRGIPREGWLTASGPRSNPTPEVSGGRRAQQGQLRAAQDGYIRVRVCCSYSACVRTMAGA